MGLGGSGRWVEEVMGMGDGGEGLGVSEWVLKFYAKEIKAPNWSTMSRTDHYSSTNFLIIRDNESLLYKALGDHGTL